jgi:hypothetical protein
MSGRARVSGKHHDSINFRDTVFSLGHVGGVKQLRDHNTAAGSAAHW